MPSIHIDNSLCCGDELCVRVCPGECLRMKEGKAAVVPLGENLCINCGQCMAVCPKMAISVNQVAPASLLSAESGIDFERFSLFAKSRRSVRTFKKTPVPHEVLMQALETARYAPTGGNRQDVEWVALEGEAKLKTFANMVVDVMREQPGLERIVKRHDAGYDIILRGAPLIVFTHGGNGYGVPSIDCSIAVNYLELTLHSMNLASCWDGFALRGVQASPEIQRFLGIPEGRQAYGALMVGYPALKYRHVPARKPVRLTWA